MIVRTHQFWSAAYHIIGKEALSKIYKVSHRQVERWGADPDFCDQVARNPLDLLVAVCKRLQEINRLDVVEAGLRRLLEPLGYSLCRSQVKSDKGSIAMELLDISQEAGDLARTYHEANSDYDISRDEQAELLARADFLIEETNQLKDAIKRGKEVVGGKSGTGCRG